MGFCLPARRGIARAEHGTPPYRALTTAKDRSGAHKHILNPNSGVQGCPKSVLGFLIQNCANVTKDYCALRSRNRRCGTEHLDHEVFLRDTARFPMVFRNYFWMRR
jgi:hypothetical protein